MNLHFQLLVNTAEIDCDSNFLRELILPILNDDISEVNIIPLSSYKNDNTYAAILESRNFLLLESIRHELSSNPAIEAVVRRWFYGDSTPSELTKWISLPKNQKCPSNDSLTEAVNAFFEDFDIPIVESWANTDNPKRPWVKLYSGRLNMYGILKI